MTSATWVILGAGFAIAAANGANDVSKGIATLVGSGVTDYRRAIRWGTLWTGLGAIAGAAVAQSMMKTFGQGLVSPQVTPSLDAALATVAGAAAWIVLATRLSLPVSTTHAIVGSLIGAGLTAYGFGGLAWEALAGKVVLPLLLSPVLAWTVTTLIARLRPTAAPAFSADADCLCANLDASHVEPAGFGGAVVLRNSVRLDLMLGETAMYDWPLMTAARARQAWPTILQAPTIRADASPATSPEPGDAIRGLRRAASTDIARLGPRTAAGVAVQPGSGVALPVAVPT